MCARHRALSAVVKSQEDHSPHAHAHARTRHCYIHARMIIWSHVWHTSCLTQPCLYTWLRHASAPGPSAARRSSLC